MKILFDTEVLAMCQHNKSLRTGVYRVIENVLDGLYHSAEVELTFSIDHHISNYAKVFLAEHPYLNKVEIAFPKASYKRAEAFLAQGIRFEKALGRRSQQASPRVQRTLEIVRKVAYRTRITGTAYLKRLELAGVDIYHSPFHPLPVTLRGTKIKKFLTVYDLIPVMFPQYFPDQKGNHTVKTAIDGLGPDDYVFAISQSTKNDLCNYRPDISPEHVIVTHLAASKRIFYQCKDHETIAAVKLQAGIPDGQYFLSLCTIEPRKNLDRVINSFYNLVRQEKLEDTYLVLVGARGWKFDHIFEEAEKNRNLAGKIIFTGRIEDDKLAALYSGSIGFIYPSLYEGFGLPPLEAMQCGVPVITSNNSSLPEVVGEAGIMVDAQDEDALCQAMLRVYRDRELREQMAEKSLAQAAGFSWEKCVQQTVAGYKMALNA